MQLELDKKQKDYKCINYLPPRSIYCIDLCSWSMQDLVSD